jgi:hypothetical protein
MTNIEGTKSRQLTKDDIALMVRELVLVTLPGSVLKVEMAILDRQSKGKAVNE